MPIHRHGRCHFGHMCWCYLNISIRFVSVGEVTFVLFNSMLKYMINRSMHAFFHIRTVIIPRDRYRPEGYEVLCRLLFALLFFFHLGIVLSVCRLTVSGYPLIFSILYMFLTVGYNIKLTDCYKTIQKVSVYASPLIHS